MDCQFAELMEAGLYDSVGEIAYVRWNMPNAHAASRDDVRLLLTFPEAGCTSNQVLRSHTDIDTPIGMVIEAFRSWRFEDDPMLAIRLLDSAFFEECDCYNRALIRRFEGIIRSNVGQFRLARKDFYDAKRELVQKGAETSIVDVGLASVDRLEGRLRDATTKLIALHDCNVVA